ncbi:MLO-like protein 1 [Apostasia shenzhenica]|uniref:MLO-like protein 1 n=1 Tax=Apostasia shenzhenica TaxID=1088818 RepID=A0A2I0AK68_9ASPA|nr:MLO-like protein 1 [Apostasia shenzhenica]
MGSSFKPAIFEEHVQEGLMGWAQKVKMKTKRMDSGVSAPKSEGVQLQKVSAQESSLLKESQVEIVEDGSRSTAQTLGDERLQSTSHRPEQKN